MLSPSSSLPVKAILLSRDRATQVDATLRSFYLYCRDIQLADIHVLYRASTPRYKVHYRKLELAYPKVFMIKREIQ